MKNQESRLCAKTTVCKQRGEQIHNQDHQRNDGDANTNSCVAGTDDSEHRQHEHPEKRQTQRGKFPH